MSRLIDAYALYEKLNKIRKEEIALYGVGNSRFCSTLSTALYEIEFAPTIEQRKTGKWIKVHGYCTPGGDPVWACSECGKGVHVYGIEHGTYGADISDGQWKACPNCSALMEGEQV